MYGWFLLEKSVVLYSCICYYHWIQWNRLNSMSKYIKKKENSMVTLKVEIITMDWCRRWFGMIRCLGADKTSHWTPFDERKKYCTQKWLKLIPILKNPLGGAWYKQQVWIYLPWNPGVWMRYLRISMHVVEELVSI